MRLLLFLLISGVAAHASASQGNDSRDVRAFMEAIATGIAGYEQRAAWHAKEDVVCLGLEAVDAASGKRRNLDPDTAIGAARALGADAAEPKVTPNGMPCGALMDFGVVAFDADLLTGVVKRRPSVEAAWREPRMVRSMFPMFHWDRRENLSPDGRWYQTLIGDDIGMRSPLTNEVVRLTSDGAPDHQYFQAYDIWERAGEQWSPDSTRFVGRLHDARGSKGLLVFDTLRGEEVVKRFTYWTRAGDALPVTTLFVFDVRSRSKIALSETGSRDSYLFFLDWSPDGRRVAYVRVARDAKRYEVFEADAATGEAVRILEEIAQTGMVKWPGPPKTFHYLPDGKQFLWRSDRDGYSGYYLYARDGKPPRKVSPDGYDVTLVGVDATSSALILTGAPDPTRPFDHRLLRLPLGARTPSILASETGVHEAMLSASGRFLLDKHHDLDRPPVTVIRSSLDGRIVAGVQRASLSAALAAWPAPERVVGRAADGKTAVHGVLYRPFGFDPRKRYPVVERIYGGMQLRAAPSGFAGLDEDDYEVMLAYLASRGFVVVMLDAPGTPGRGRDYLMARHGSWPDGIIADHAAALREIASTRPWMDMSRVGIDGNSFGGMLALRGALEEPSLYRAVAASVPQTDLLDSIAWMEFQVGNVAHNRAAYERGALAPRMKDLSAPLLLVAGTSDVNVTFSNLTTLLDALAEAGKRYRLVLFPQTNHTHDGRGDRYAYAVAQIATFFETELGGPR